jgi:superfamily II DNA or RNA helicase
VGRFGLGFRRLLRLGGTVDFFSSDIGFRFDPQWCAAEARKAARLDPEADAPGMRLVKPLEIENERKADQILSSLHWADTVVRAQLAHPNSLQAMRRELDAFPIEFLLFPSTNITLDLIDETGGGRHLRRLMCGTLRILVDGKREDSWHVFSNSFPVDDAAASEDAGALHARENVRISWAIPAAGRDAPAGRFWNAFPTQTPSVLPGVLDAHWKVNSDRSALTGQAWNAALMRCAAKLVAENLCALATPDDPGRPIGCLPRQLERRDEPAAPLHDALWLEVGQRFFVSNASGRMCRPDALLRAPLDDAALQAAWDDIAPVEMAVRLIHHTCVGTRERASRLEQLAASLVGNVAKAHEDDSDYEEEIDFDSLDEGTSTANLRRLPSIEWLQRVATHNVALARDVILLAGRLAEKHPEELFGARNAYVIPTQDRTLAPAVGVVLTRSDGSATTLRAVHANLIGDAEVHDALTRLLLVKGSMDDAAWLKELVSAWHRRAPPFDDAWTLLRAAPTAVIARLVAERRSLLRVKACDGQWKCLDDVLLAGEIIAESAATGNEAVLVDQEFGREYSALLSVVRVTDVPQEGFATCTSNQGFREAAQWVSRYYERKQPQASRAQVGTLGFSDTKQTALAGAEILKSASMGSRIPLSLLLLTRLTKLPIQNVYFGGKGSPPTIARYPHIPAPDPTAWLLWKYGRVDVGGINVSLAACSELRRDLTASEQEAIGTLLPSDTAILDRWADGWPVFKSPPEPVWQALLASRHTIDHAALLPLWEAAAARSFAPGSIPGVGSDTDVPLANVYVSTSADGFDLAEAARVPCVRLSPKAVLVWLNRGAKDVEKEIAWRRIGEPTDFMPAVDYILGLDAFIVGGCPAIAFVERIERSFGGATSPAPLMLEGKQLLLSREWLRETPKAHVYWRLLQAIGDQAAFSVPIDQVFETLDLDEVRKHRAEIAALPDLPARLFLAAGDRQALIDSLPDAARRALQPDTPDLAVAALCLDISGPSALRALQPALERQNLRPPSRWGSDEARQFVLALGFPLSFAGAANPRRLAELSVAGPRPLPPLHDYQEVALGELQSLIGADSNGCRAVLSLPTGAGKTRVAVETAIRSVLTSSHYRPLVLWVAQTEELAEQAVEAFRHVWAVEGLEATDLRIVRFWGGQPTPSEADDAQPTVIVALVQTLSARMGQEEASWLSATSLVVIDESHHGIAPSYTELLNRAGITTGQRQAARTRSGQREPALLGLSATPFRSNDEDESRLLARRFDAKVVPVAQADLYSKLRQEGILSIVDKSMLEFPQLFQLTIEERADLDQFGELPGTALERMAGNAARNEVILSAVEAAPERSILLFANSVDHSMELAARLSLRGIRARSVSGMTDRSARRDAVSAFKKGEVRVICNAVVFATGFDAPGVDLVLIARPVFSPVRFMQMVGRGLRGPKNGGTERCRILTVRDNIEGYANRDPLDLWRKYYE